MGVKSKATSHGGGSNKKAKTSGGPAVDDSPLRADLTSEKSVANLRKSYDSSAPYHHLVLENFCDPERMRCIHEEAKQNMTTTFKETDLFKVYQTGDLGGVDPKMAKTMPHLMALRQALYSVEFRQFICSITGVDDLTDRIDCSANAYVQGCHLLCHDDVIGTRRVSYIVYLTDPDDEWIAADGGALELYPLERSSQIDRGEEHGGLQGIPTANPTAGILPLFNSMALFAVKPGRSYHSVQEVFADKPRLSISGWYHGPCPPLGSDKASLSQIISKGDDQRPFTPLPPLPAPSADASLSETDMKVLSTFINSTYLQPECMEQICEQFGEDSSVQLKDFLRADLALSILKVCIDADERNLLGNGRPPMSYEVGVADDWGVVGPPHKRRHLLYSADARSAHSANTAASQVGAHLHTLLQKLFRSAAFGRYLEILTTLRVRGYRDEIRRFRPGLDYTVAHCGAMTNVPRLDATLCFVAGPMGNSSGVGKKGRPSSDDEDDDDDNEDEDDDDNEDEDEDDGGDDDPWASGNVGGFECYIEADTKEGGDTAEAAEVYKGPGADNEEEDETSLLSVSPGANVLSLVMRDTEVMRFIKYVSSSAPSSRWDAAVEFEIEPEAEEDEEV